MMQIVEMSTSVEFKMWSMSPLIAVPLTNQSHSPYHNMGVTWDIIHTLTVRVCMAWHEDRPVELVMMNFKQKMLQYIPY